MITLADGIPQFSIDDHGFSDSEIEQINEKLQAWAKERKCVNCKWIDRVNSYDDDPTDVCMFLDFNFPNNGINDIQPETFHCAAWEKK